MISKNSSRIRKKTWCNVKRSSVQQANAQRSLEEAEEMTLEEQVTELGEKIDALAEKVEEGPGGD